MRSRKRAVQRLLGPMAALGLVYSPTAAAEQSYSPYVDRNDPSRVYWGDTHLHTNMSLDANGVGNKALTPDDAYRFAKGQAVTANNGMKVRLHRPLDFLVVADHAENLGVMPLLEAADPILLETETGRRWHKLMRQYPLKTKETLTFGSWRQFVEIMNSVYEGVRNFFGEAFGYRDDGPGHIASEALRRSIWAEVIENAERNYEPGKFTAFIGYEWTSTPASRGYPNLHRVVIFRDGRSKAIRALPFTGIDSADPERLWAQLAQYEKETGGAIIAVPHNSNLSNGEMFALQDFEGRPLSRAYAEIRSKWEPLMEVTQIKGDSETHPILSPTDEFADFGIWNSGRGPTYEGITTEGWEKRKASEYARSALKLGLAEQARLGANPFKFGLIGSTDSHTSLATADDDNFWGKFSLLEPSPYRTAAAGEPAPWKKYVYSNASGYAAVWAVENTREALFAAMKRRETYATTGPRMVVRFFGGWNYAQEDALKPDLARIGYSKGVPMGGDLTNAPNGKAPTFLIRAIRDPDGANLDRVQVVKGWRSKEGRLYEKIFNVALSDGRRVGKDGKAPSVSSTVDVKNATYTNSIGDPELALVWTDPDFKSQELAFYYLRILEIPTPRWTAYDAKFFGRTDLPKDVPMVTQERAYTSPIWYSP